MSKSCRCSQTAIVDRAGAWGCTLLRLCTRLLDHVDGLGLTVLGCSTYVMQLSLLYLLLHFSDCYSSAATSALSAAIQERLFCNFGQSFAL